MRYIFDSNIVIHLVKDTSIWKYIKEKYDPLHPENQVSICTVSNGETRSFARQNKWGKKKLEALKTQLSRFGYQEIYHSKVQDAYVEIDVFSQGKHETLTLPEGNSARNMGKNDLWIAAVTHTTNAKLISTDKDFLHLDPSFFEFIYIDVEEVRKKSS